MCTFLRAPKRAEIWPNFTLGNIETIKFRTKPSRCEGYIAWRVVRRARNIYYENCSNFFQVLIKKFMIIPEFCFCWFHHVFPCIPCNYNMLHRLVTKAWQWRLVGETHDIFTGKFHFNGHLQNFDTTRVKNIISIITLCCQYHNPSTTGDIMHYDAIFSLSQCFPSD